MIYTNLHVLQSTAEWVKKHLKTTIKMQTNEFSFDLSYKGASYQVIVSINNELLIFDCMYTNYIDHDSNQLTEWLSQSRLFMPRLVDGHVYLTSSFPLFDLSIRDIDTLMVQYMNDLYQWLDELVST